MEILVGGHLLIDYYAHTLALDELRKALAAAPFTDAALVSARNQTMTDLSLAGDHALLGALVDHIFAHAVSDGTELAMLGHASHLYSRGVTLYQQLAAVRGDFEGALAAPANPASAARFNSAAVNLQVFAQEAYAIQAEVTKLRDGVALLPYISPHPRQMDQPADSWDWGNRLLGRRTDAFVRNLARLAKNSPTRAFAFGALSSYCANVAGSAYLGNVVGGPRRSHRFRDRVARNSVGTWLARQYPSLPTLGTIAQNVRFGTAKNPTLPPGVGQLLNDALKATFDLSRTPPPPDLQLGYGRLVQHLQLLDDFVLPPIPLAPSDVWAAQLYGDPASPPPSLRVQDTGFSGDPDGGVTYTGNLPGDSQPGQSDSSGGSTICGIIMAILIIVDLVQAFVQCIVQWAKKQTCTFWDNMLLKKLWEKDPPDPRTPPGPPEDPGTNSAQLTAMAASDEVLQLIGALYDIHGQIWEALDRTNHFLALHGLTYPGYLIDLPVYKQFTSVPASTEWPHRPVTDPISSYHLYPSSPLEHPTAKTSSFTASATPDAFLTLSASEVALPLWRQIAYGVTDTQNFDMDADRDFRYPCWADKSINFDPVNVQVLAYGDQ